MRAHKYIQTEMLPFIPILLDGSIFISLFFFCLFFYFHLFAHTRARHRIHFHLQSEISGWFATVFLRLSVKTQHFFMLPYFTITHSFLTFAAALIQNPSIAQSFLHEFPFQSPWSDTNPLERDFPIDCHRIHIIYIRSGTYARTHARTHTYTVLCTRYTQSKYYVSIVK